MIYFNQQESPTEAEAFDLVKAQDFSYRNNRYAFCFEIKTANFVKLGIQLTSLVILLCCIFIFILLFISIDYTGEQSPSIS